MERILESIYHDSTKNYVSNPFPQRGEEIEIKIRMLKNDLVKGVFLRYRELGAEKILEMKEAYEKNGLVYYTINIKVYDLVLTYQFNITTEGKIYSYSQHKVTDYLQDESTSFKILRDYKAPSWMKDQVFYQIMPDRFYNARPDLTYTKDSFEYQGARPMQMYWDQAPHEWDISRNLDFYGGDLWGVLEKLDYLQDLGVTGIYFNPLFKSPTMHKYDALDYFEIDETLGGEEALIALSDEMHKRGMKLVLDISINHTSSDSKWFNKDGIFYPKDQGAYNNPDSEERNYYFIEEDGSYESWFGVQSMPSLNYTNEKVRDIIYRNEDSVLKKYLKPPFNIDGWRFDVADVMARNYKADVYYEVWEEINEAIKSVNPQALIMAEEWADAPEMYQQNRWDSTMNYFAAARPIREFAGEKDLFTQRHEVLRKIDYDFTGQMLEKRILQFMDKHPSEISYQMFNLIDSHDVSRLHNNEKIDFDVYKGAVMTTFGLPGAVNIYYGDEKYLDGRLPTMEGCRYPMDWTEPDQLESHKKEIYDLYQTLAHLKKDEALRSGGFRIFHAKNDIFAFVRFIEDRAYIFVWTKSDQEETITFDLGQLGLKTGFDKIIGNPKIDINGDLLTMTTGPRESFVISLS